jgi:hypothetical protein
MVIASAKAKVVTGTAFHIPIGTVAYFKNPAKPFRHCLYLCPLNQQMLVLQ